LKKKKAFLVNRSEAAKDERRERERRKEDKMRWGPFFEDRQW
jgi:hypothetical protein